MGRNVGGRLQGDNPWVDGWVNASTFCSGAVNMVKSCTIAGVAELADARDLKSLVLFGRAGSSPASGIAQLGRRVLHDINLGVVWFSSLFARSIGGVFGRRGWRGRRGGIESFR